MILRSSIAARWASVVLALPLAFTGLCRPAHARDTGEFGLQVIDVANKYTSALLAAKICHQYTFDTAEQEQNFGRNHETAKIYGARIFMEENPGVAEADLAAKAEYMDKLLIANVTAFHASEGCQHSLLRTFLKWFVELKQIPLQPLPNGSSYAEYTVEAQHWLVLHPRD
ncbi:hypothetical protein C8J38_1361 [Rhizobium sp. PP-WC-2G-219]|nr:hypothetical protein C8J38_1361 [Rhizobium sp. PP-WC-2G-219]